MATATTLTVACKLPNGLFLDLMGEEEFNIVPSNSGPVKQVSRKILKRVFVRGVAAERRLDRSDENGRPVEHAGLDIVQGGYGLTFDVDAAFFEAWLEQNRDYPPVKGGLIFATTREKASARAREQEELRSGLEPIDPANPGRGLKPLTKAA